MGTNEQLLIEIYEKLQRLLSGNEEISEILSKYDDK